MPDTSDGTERLRQDLQRLHAAVVHWSPTRWERPAPGAVGRRAAEVMQDLVGTLVMLGREAGSPVPADVVPGKTGVHALVDQLAVVGGELLAAPQAGAVADRARTAVGDTRTALFG